MKKVLALFLAFALIFSLAACSSKKTEPDVEDSTTQAAEPDSGNTITENTVPDDSTTLSSMPVSQDVAAQEAAAAKLKDYDVDIDIDQLGSDMATAQMREIDQNRSNYLGKTIRVTGSYQSERSEEYDTTYNYLLGYDSTGCCAAWGIEFYGDEVPEDIPQYETISVVGTLATYDEGGQKYLYIDVAHFSM